MTAKITCADCGGAMIQNFIVLTLSSGCQRIPSGPPTCTTQECRERRAAEDRADRARADREALDRALASGLVVPDDTPEEDRWVR